MKNLLTLCLLLLSFPLIQAATLTVNNTSPTVGQYRTVPAAVDAAASGDTILIQGSQRPYYEEVFLPRDKALTLRGGGWKPSRRPSPYKTQLSNIILNPFASNITIEGIEASSISTLDSAQVSGQSNIKIQFCYIGALGIGKYCHDFVIQNNVIAVVGNSHTSNILIQNNFVGYISGFSGYDHPTAGYRILPTNVRLDHNVVGGDTRYVEGIIVTNNIFYNAVTSDMFISCIINNNLTYFSGSGAIQNFISANRTLPRNYLCCNLINTDPLFVVEAFANYDFRLQPNSPCKNAGTDGKDIGINTDVFTFSRTGEVTPSVRLFEITTPAITTPNGTINIKMTASKARDGN